MPTYTSSIVQNSSACQSQRKIHLYRKKLFSSKRFVYSKYAIYLEKTAGSARIIPGKSASKQHTHDFAPSLNLLFAVRT